MGVDLISTKQSAVSYTRHTWRLILDLALYGGWDPARTQHPDIEDWSGSYLSNDGQRVNAEDARDMGMAVRRAYGRLQHPNIDLDVPTRRFSEAAKDLVDHRRIEALNVEELITLTKNPNNPDANFDAPAR